VSEEQKKKAPTPLDQINIEEFIAESPLMQRLKDQGDSEEVAEMVEMVESTAKYYQGVIRMFKDSIKTKEDLEKLFRALESSK